MSHMIDGETAYTEVTPLEDDEKAWLLDFIFPDLLDLPDIVSSTMFYQLWEGNAGACKTCGADEGYCLNSTCIRTRVTNKLMLSGGSRS